MTRHAFIVRLFACGLALGLTAIAGQAATASGNLVHSDHTPAPRIRVTVSNNQGRSAPAYSDNNGSYTLHGIPAGQYFLEVWLNPRTPTTIGVTIKEPNTPLPQVTVP